MTMSADTMAHVIDFAAEWRDHRWWCRCPLACCKGKGGVAIWDSVPEGAVAIVCHCGCSTDKLRTWMAGKP